VEKRVALSLRRPAGKGKRVCLCRVRKAAVIKCFGRARPSASRGTQATFQTQLAYCGSVRQPGFLFAIASVRAGDHHPHRRGDLLQAILMGGGSYAGRFNPAGTGISSSLN
jgi:hypothetical protein